MQRRLIGIIGSSALALAVAGAGLSRAADRQAASPTQPATTTVTVGWGDRDYAENVFTPEQITVYAGDRVRFVNNSALEPHTVTFGSTKAIIQWLGPDGPFTFIPKKNGPPTVAWNPRVFNPTKGDTYDGTGIANSGVLVKGQSWTVSFSKPGTYHYICIIHYGPAPTDPKMEADVIVKPRPAAGHLYRVMSGSEGKYSVADGFFPRHLTIHAGDSVQWSPGFHTVTFGPEDIRQQLEKTFNYPETQKNGQKLIVFNPKVIFPSANATGPNVTYDGNGFLNSGLMLGDPTNPNAKPTPFKVTFTKPGAYEYDCLIHPGMDGTITVLP